MMDGMSSEERGVHVNDRIEQTHGRTDGRGERDMTEGEEARIRFTDAVTETVTVTPLGGDRYRLEVTPVSSVIEELGAYYGAVIAATPEPDGSLRVRTLVAHSSLRMTDVLVRRDIVESDAFRAFADAVTAAGGYAERVFGGVLFVYVPNDSPFDPAAELDKVVARIKADKDS